MNATVDTAVSTTRDLTLAAEVRQVVMRDDFPDVPARETPRRFSVRWATEVAKRLLSPAASADWNRKKVQRLLNLLEREERNAARERREVVIPHDTYQRKYVPEISPTHRIVEFHPISRLRFVDGCVYIPADS